MCSSGDPWADYQRPFTAEQAVDGVADEPGQPLPGNFNQLKKLKAKHPDLKVLISLGGWTWSKYFSDAALTADSRRALVESCIDLFIKGNLPGLRRRRRRRRVRRHRPRLGVAGLGGQRRQRHPARGQAELHRAGRRVPQPARRVRRRAGSTTS